MPSCERQSCDLHQDNLGKTPQAFGEPYTKCLSIYITPEQQRLIANSLLFSISIARYQASQRPMPSRSLLSCSAQVVLGRPRDRFHPGPGALPQRAPIAVQSASRAVITGCMRATCPKRASLLRLTLGSMSSRRVRSFTSKCVIEPADP